MTLRRTIASFWAVVLVILAVCAGFASGGQGLGREAGRFGISGVASGPSDDRAAPVEAYSEALAVLKREYYPTEIGPSKEKDLTYAAIRGMLFSLGDPYTTFLDPQEFKEMMEGTSGSFQGIGAELQKSKQDIRIVRPLPNSPALRAGVKSGDVIVAVGTHDPNTGKLIKTTSMIGKETEDAVRLIRGPAGTKVSLTLLRAGALLHLTIVRSQVEPSIVRYWMEDPVNKIGRIVLTEFAQTSTAQFDKAMEDLERQGMRALIFDLRYNPGGLLDVAIDIGSRFVDHGTIVIIQEANGQRILRNARGSGASTWRRPLVVLVNGSSASASEIVAGAIKDHGVGTLVGEHTFGKGCVQTLSRLGDGSALKLTTAKYFPPSGKDINNRVDEDHRPIPGTGGISVDVEVKQSDDWPEMNFEDKKDDTQLHKAIDILRTKLAAR
jgi:carboxyl-terminal processing protease